jgi:hypothetical protein
MQCSQTASTFICRATLTPCSPIFTPLSCASVTSAVNTVHAISLAPTTRPTSSSYSKVLLCPPLFILTVAVNARISSMLVTLHSLMRFLVHI